MYTQKKKVVDSNANDYDNTCDYYRLISAYAKWAKNPD